MSELREIAPGTYKARAVLVDEARYTAVIDYAGAPMFPGGKLEPGETSRQAVEREVMEELGLAITAEDFLCSYTRFATNYPDRNGTIHKEKVTTTDYFYVPLEGSLNDLVNLDLVSLSEQEAREDIILMTVALSALGHVTQGRRVATNPRASFFRDELLAVNKVLRERGLIDGTHNVPGENERMLG